MEQRIPLVLLGRVIGATSGADQVSDTTLHFFDVEISNDPDFSVPFDMSFDYVTGIIEIYDDEGRNVLTQLDALDYLYKQGFVGIGE